VWLENAKAVRSDILWWCVMIVGVIYGCEEWA
jgi:hypothetical protein